ncbi:N-acetyltransferase domain-containing protein [Frankia sp. AiPs1]|uniref:GNAT family N-acetyltransferase n=1 Tax=Frankia sp. AiPa1 TaxID=573492 RepID=UPI00202B17BA|nr:GNAT family N-acetyltransferase [Frankia sp. AiPa1]MCL9758622.1 GNAT family N-acetyltransferase [Frankia sp. AiPa1]
MAWHLTENLEEYLAAAGPFLRARPVENTVLLTVAESLRTSSLLLFGAAAPLFGWWVAEGRGEFSSDSWPAGQKNGKAHTPQDWRPDSGAVQGAFLQTPPHGLLLTALAESAVEPLAASWPRGRPLPSVHTDERTACSFAAAWGRRRSDSTTLSPAASSASSSSSASSPVPPLRQRLYRLGELVSPAPAPAGRSRVAREADRDLLIAWAAAFEAEAESGLHSDHEAMARRVDDRLGHAGYTFWEVDGVPVSLAGNTRSVAGTVRIGPVYTPPAFRRCGYAGAVTAAVGLAARQAGASEIVLFTDLSNPTSNGVYQRLGFVPVADRIVLRLEPDPG